MTICLRNSCSVYYDMSFLNIYQMVCASFPFGFEGEIWDLLVLLPGHCLPFNVEKKSF